MAEVYRIEINVSVRDVTEKGLTAATQKLTSFEKTARKTEQQLAKMNRTETKLRMSAVDRATPVIRAVSSLARSAGKTYHLTFRVLDFATRPIRAIGGMLTSTLGLLGVGGGIAGGIVWPLMLADNLNKASIGFETMLGSAEKAQAFMKEIQQFAIETPFGTEEVIQNANLLMALGFQQERVIPMMRAVGDAVAAMGGGADKIERIIVALGQMQAKGRVSAEEMLQLTENNINAWQFLADSMGLSIAQVRKLAEDGKIQAAPAIEAILRGMEKTFGGQMQKNANRTLSGILSQLRDTFDQRILLRWGQGLQGGVITVLRRLNDWIERNQDTIARWGDALEKAGRIVGDWVVRKFEDLQQIVRDLVNSPEWRQAKTMGDRLKLAWDKVIAEPFDQWWNSGGNEWIKERGIWLVDQINAGIKEATPRIAQVAVPLGIEFAKGLATGVIEAGKSDPKVALILGALLGIQAGRVLGPVGGLVVGAGTTGALLLGGAADSVKEQRLQELPEFYRQREEQFRLFEQRRNELFGIEPHDVGGIFSRPHVGLVAESGPESIIPIQRGNPRSIGLWAETGRRLGVSSGPQVNVAPGAIVVNINGGSENVDAQQLGSELADAFVYQLGRNLEMLWANTP